MVPDREVEAERDEEQGDRRAADVLPKLVRVVNKAVARLAALLAPAGKMEESLLFVEGDASSPSRFKLRCSFLPRDSRGGE